MIKVGLKHAGTDYITVSITQNEANTYVLTGTGSDVLAPPSSAVTAGSGPFDGYVKIDAFIAEREHGFTHTYDEIIVPYSGTFLTTSAWAGFRHTQTNSMVGYVFGFERDGMIYFSQRPTVGRVPNQNEVGNIAGGGSFEAEAGDKISVWVASDTSGTVTINNLNLTVINI